MLAYRSGASNRSDFDGYTQACVPIGVDVQQVSKPVMGMIADYLQAGGRVFVDSGAFGAFRKGRALSDADYDRMFDRYGALVDRVCDETNTVGTSRLTVVMPDVVGDGEATMTLQRRYAGTINAFAMAGVDVLMPVQQGVEPRRWAEHFATLFPSGRFRVAIPANAAAYEMRELHSLFHHLRRRCRGVHFLGIAARVDALSRLTRITRTVLGAGIEVTCDANRLRAQLPKIQTEQRQIKNDLARELQRDTDVVDETEVFIDASPQDLASTLGVPVAAIEAFFEGDDEALYCHLADERELLLATHELAVRYAEELIPGGRTRSAAIARVERKEAEWMSMD